MRKTDLLLILCSGVLLLSLSLSFLLLPHQSFSVVENRALTTWRLPTAEELFDGRAATMLSALYADQFPLRSLFTATKAEIERLLGKQENNGVFFSSKNTLLPRDEYADLTIAESNLAALCALFENTSLPCHLLLAPRAMDVMNEKLPLSYSVDSTIFEQIANSGIPYTLPTEALRAAERSGAEVWYRTDHHWSTYGAYLAYIEVSRALGVSPYPLSFFRQEQVSSSFLGTSHAKVGGIKIEPDVITLFRYEGDSEITLTNEETKEVSYGFYDITALTEKDHYRIFLGGNYGRLSVTRSPEESPRPRLLLIKDSYANAIVPFLSLHFDLELIDPRYYEGAIQDLLSDCSLDGVLVVLGVHTLASEPSLKRITR